MRSGSVKPATLDGVAGRPVSTIEVDGLAALTSTLPEGQLRVRRRDLLQHLQVLEAVFAETTIVPCAFGTVLQSPQLVERELLDARHDELLQMIERLDGRAQLNITATYDEEIVLREVVESHPGIASLSRQSRDLGSAALPANIRLGEAVAATLAELRAVDGQRVVDRLAAEADDVVIEEAPATAALKASFLVARKRLRRFDAALEKLAAAEAPRLSFESIGPLPPTAFVNLGAAG